MAYYPEIIEKLIEKLKKFPGVGPKSAERILDYLINLDEKDVISLSENLIALKRQVKVCNICFNLTENNICKICQDNTRQNIICVVEEVKDLILIEKTGYKGKYHILWGRLSIGENIVSLKIPQLIKRLEKENPDEIIIATNPTSEGEDTANYLIEILKNRNIKISRIAIGIPVGAEIEFIDTNTLKKSIENRKPV